MADVRAADLPEGSIVANADSCLRRSLDGPGAVWHGTDGRRYYDEHVQWLLDAVDAKVLRNGYGEEA